MLPRIGTRNRCDVIKALSRESFILAEPRPQDASNNTFRPQSIRSCAAVESNCIDLNGIFSKTRSVALLSGNGRAMPTLFLLFVFFRAFFLLFRLALRLGLRRPLDRFTLVARVHNQVRHDLAGAKTPLRLRLPH